MEVTETTIPASGKVYFAQIVGDGPIKIGYTYRDPAKRLKELDTSCPYAVELKAAQETTVDAEGHLHKVFADANIRNEWFWPTGKLLRLIAHVADGGNLWDDVPEPEKKKKSKKKMGKGFAATRSKAKTNTINPEIIGMKKDPRCKICKAAQREQIDKLLTLHTQADVWRFANETWSLGLTRKNVSNHWQKHVVIKGEQTAE